MMKLEKAVKMCIDIGACAEGAKVLARQGLVKELKRVEELHSGNPTSNVEILSNTAHVRKIIQRETFV